MLIYFSQYDKKEYSLYYNKARIQIDALCRLIIERKAGSELALAIYKKIEAEFTEKEPEMIDLFEMIYKSRIKRLLSQHNFGDGNGK